MAKVDVIMPQMGESIAEGTLSRWMKKAGDAVQRDEPIFEISTDKVDAEIPSPTAGVLAEILVNEGETVAVQTVVARIETDASAAASAPAPPRLRRRQPPRNLPRKRPLPRAAPKEAAPKAAAPPPAPAAPARAPQPSAPAARPAADATGDNGSGESLEERLRRRSTPLVRKMAAEHNLDLSAISGTGLAGRVTKNDILDHLETAQSAPAPAPAISETRPAARAPAPPTSPSSPSSPSGVEPWEGDRVEPWSRIRKLTAEHMVMSRRVSPHVNTIFEIDYTRVALSAPRPSATTPRGAST